MDDLQTIFLAVLVVALCLALVASVWLCARRYYHCGQTQADPAIALADISRRLDRLNVGVTTQDPTPVPAPTANNVSQK